MTTEEAEAFFAALGPVPLASLGGFWRGRAVATGHPVDELLRASSWCGKEFLSPEEVHPLIHEGAFGRYRLNPGLVPLALARRFALARLPGARAAFRVFGPLLATRRPRARLRMIDDRGALTSAMIYDQRPIVDVFRKVDDDTIMGRMDERGQPPFFFLLVRE
jgi:hypothetical protein